MSPALSVITPLHPDKASHLGAAFESLLGENDVDWRWLIQIDGASADLPEPVRAHPRVDIAVNGRWLGTGATRNRAMLRVDGPYVATLDADDLIVPGGLRVLSDALDGHPEVGFAWGDVIDFLPDGHSELAAKGSPYPMGVVDRARIEENWLRTGADGMFFCALCWRTDVILELGGWSAIPGMEDTALVLGASHRYPGYRAGQVVQRYRRHGGQTTLSERYGKDRAANRTWIWLCSNARRRAAGWRTYPMPPDPYAAPESDRARRLQRKRVST